MPDENGGTSRRSLLRVAGAVAVTIFGLSKVASAAKAKALEKKGYVETFEEDSSTTEYEVSGKKTATKKKKVPAKKKKAAKKKKKAPVKKKKAAKKKKAPAKKKKAAKKKKTS